MQRAYRVGPDVWNSSEVSHLPANNNDVSNDSVAKITDRQMTDRFDTATVQAEGLFALGTALLVVVYIGALWFAAYRLASKNARF